MNIEKVGNRWRITEMRSGIRYRVSVDYKPTKKQAEELMRKKISEGNINTKATDSFNDAALKYCELKSNILSPWTINGYKAILRALSDTFKQSKLVNIDQIMVQKEINRYSADHSPKSTRNVHGFISAVLSVYKPSLKLSTTLPEKDKFEPYAPSNDDIKRILDEVAGTKYEIAFRLGALSGMRRGEICAITSEDVWHDEEQDAYYVHIGKAKVLSSDKNGYIVRQIPKTTDSIRDVLIDEELAKMILACDGEIFPYNPPALRDHLSDIQDQLEIPHFRFHDLRAYHATDLRYKGIPDKIITDRCGWKNVATLEKHYQRTQKGKQAEYKDAILSVLSSPKNSPEENIKQSS